MPKHNKPVNPEAKLQQSVQRDIKIRHLEETAKVQADLLAAAKWEVALHQKDEIATKKKADEYAMQNIKDSGSKTKEIRKNNLKDLYEADEKRYEDELQSKGLSFFRQRI